MHYELLEFAVCVKTCAKVDWLTPIHRTGPWSVVALQGLFYLWLGRVLMLFLKKIFDAAGNSF